MFYGYVWAVSFLAPAHCPMLKAIFLWPPVAQVLPPRIFTLFTGLRTCQSASIGQAKAVLGYLPWQPDFSKSTTTPGYENSYSPPVLRSSPVGCFLWWWIPHLRHLQQEYRSSGTESRQPQLSLPSLHTHTGRCTPAAFSVLYLPQRQPAPLGQYLTPARH